jgi:hypothetical protein
MGWTLGALSWKKVGLEVWTRGVPQRVTWTTPGVGAPSVWGKASPTPSARVQGDFCTQGGRVMCLGWGGGGLVNAVQDSPFAWEVSKHFACRGRQNYFLEYD